MGFLKADWKGLAVIGFGLAAQQLHSRAAITFANDPFTLSEGAGAVALKITRDEAVAALSVAYRIIFNGAEATADFTSTSGRVDFAANQTEATVDLVPRRDGLVEGTELFELELSNPSTAAPVGVCAIRLLDEQVPVGRDYSFTPVKNPSLIFELPDGSVLIRLGDARRLLPNGEFMSGWVADGRALQTPNRAFIYQDGSMALGDSGRVNDAKPPYLRLRADGTIDPTAVLPLIIVIGFQADGKIVGLNDRFEAVRYNPDGTPDPSFNDFNDSRLPVVDGNILADGSVLAYRNYFTEPIHLDLYSSNGIPIETGQNILCAGPFVKLRGGGFAALVPESNADNAAVGLGFFDSVGNRKTWNPISGVTSLSHFGDGLIISGNPVRYGGREDNILFVTPQGNVLSSLVALYREPVIVQPDGKLLAYTDIPTQFSGLTRFSLPNASISEIDFAEPQIIVREGETAKVRVRRRGDTSQAAAVAIRLKSGETPAGIPALFHFEPLQSEITFDVPTEQNPLPELDRRIEFTLTDLDGATVGENPDTVVRVLDKDGRPGSVDLANTARWQIDQSFVTKWGSYGDVSVHALAMSTDGHVYVYAIKDSGAEILAFNSDGLLDRSFTPIDVGSVFALATQSDGKLLIAGEIRSLFGRTVNVIGRVTPAGEFDSTFRGTTVSAHGVYGLAVQPDDKILIGGFLRDANGNAMVRLLSDGQTDPNFSLPPQTFPYVVTRIALQPDGKIVVACTTSSLGAGVVMARVNSNGSVDTTFEPQRGPTPGQFSPHAVAVQPNGRILMAIGAELRALTPSGALDADFKLGPPPDGSVAQMINLPGGKLLVAGTFKHIGGFERSGLARLNADGSVDISFDPGIGAEILHAIALPNGNYLVGGDFQSFNVLSIQNLAEIKSSVSPRFVLWKKNLQIETWFTADSGARVILDQSSDLQNWQLLESRTLEGFSTMITPAASTSSSFLRARVE